MVTIGDVDDLGEPHKLANTDLNLLVSLDALLQAESVTGAGRLLGVSQPAMSYALAKLRKLFRDPLLVRAEGGMSLTPRAEALAPSIRQILVLVRRAVDERPSFDPARDTRTFSVSASDYATLVLIQPLVRRLAREAPGVTIHLYPRSADVPQLLHDDRVDVVIEPEELMPKARFPCQRLLADRWLCAVSASNRDVGDEVDLQTWLEMPHVVYSIGRQMALNLADQHLVRQGYRRRIEFTVESFLLAPLLLQGTRLTTLVLERASAMLPQAGVRLLEPPLDLPGITEALWWNPRYTYDPGHSWLRARFTEVAASL